MKWEKKGLIYCPNGEDVWKGNSFLTPTPFLLNEDVIRVYGSFRDKEGIGRIGYVDVKVSDPLKIISISKNPVLDIGKRGMFDDNGMILGDVINVNNEIFMYYVGFQLVKKAKFLAYSGLAISADRGNSFFRYSRCPIMDRVDDALFIRAIHNVIIESNKFKIWYTAGNGWQIINGIKYPKYEMRYTESCDGINFTNASFSCLDVKDGEYRIGRPRIRKLRNQYEMMFTFGSTHKEYKIGKAFSNDGISWKREYGIEPISVSSSGWDVESVYYPATITINKKTLAFYNGDSCGKTGFGYAELKEY